MKIDAKARDEEGNMIFEGTLNQKEISFLIEYSINDLLMAGVQFNLQEPEETEEGEPSNRIKFPNAH